jgi:hypothetical protein
LDSGRSHPGGFQHGVQIRGIRGDLDAIGVKLSGEFTDLRALVEHGLLLGIGRLDSVAVVGAEPEELAALEAVEVSGLGDEARVLDRGGSDRFRLHLGVKIRHRVVRSKGSRSSHPRFPRVLPGMPCVSRTTRREYRAASGVV